MAHECPECGITCYCNGDIDDCCFSFPSNVAACTCCLGKDADDYDDYHPEDYDDGENQSFNKPGYDGRD